jgi:hypothetical protein
MGWNNDTVLSRSPAGRVVITPPAGVAPEPLETIYKALYVQAKGGLRREVASWLRTGRVQRRPQQRPDTPRPRMATP